MKKKALFVATAILFSNIIEAQSVGINNATPDASAILDVKSGTKGMLIPRTSSASRIAIANPAKGLMIYDTTTGGFWYYNSIAWISIADAGNTWNLSGNAGTNAATHFIGTVDALPLHFRVNNGWAGEIHPTSGNVFIGLGSGQANTGGAANTAIGQHSLLANTSGSNNTASGFQALYSNTTGGENTANGYHALYSNTIGTRNTANGIRALYSNTTGSNNTAYGTGSLYSNLNGGYNVANGIWALYSNTTGGNNTATGANALYSNTNGNDNTATGSFALANNSAGNNNTANGVGSLGNNTNGINNTGSGTDALRNNINGDDNTANGYRALYLNTGGFDNTAGGTEALYSNTAGNRNTAFGNQSLYSNSTGLYNTAIGWAALFSNITGQGNTASGLQALTQNTSGGFNTADGRLALLSNTTGNYNIAIGYSALSNNIGGDHNIAIGSGAGTHVSTPNIFNTISLGNDDILNAFQNQVLIGNTSIGWIGGKVNWGTYSDARIKNTIREDVAGLDFILRLRPVTYHISNKAMTTITGSKETPDFPGKYDGEKVKYTGFIAQEVEQAAKAIGYDFSGCEAPKNQWGLYSLRYAEFVVPIVKAMQEQQVIITDQQKQITLLEKRLAALEAKR